MRKKLTVGIELQYLQVHVGVSDYDVQLLLKRKKIGGHDLDEVAAPAEKHHFVGLFLFG